MFFMFDGIAFGMVECVMWVFSRHLGVKSGMCDDGVCDDVGLHIPLSL